MEILNDLPEEQYVEVDEFLAYIGIYDDDKRLNAYSRWLQKLDGWIRGRTVVEAGAGFGLISRKILEHSPAKLIAVESNPLTFNVLRNRLGGDSRVVPINMSIEEFVPSGHIDLLVHEFYGSMLYDENLFALEMLRFTPEQVFPDGGELRAAVVSLRHIHDEVVDQTVLRQLEGVIVGDLFVEHPLTPQDFDIPVARYRFGEGIATFDVDISGKDGELVAFSLFITHGDDVVCSAIECQNWSIGWTPRAGDRFRVDYIVEDGYSRTIFSWKNRTTG